jgi:hypothetical protein
MKIDNAALPAYPAHQTTAHQVALQMVAHIPRGSKGYEPAYIAALAAASVGLTKREAFVMAATQGILSNPYLVTAREINGHDTPEFVAKHAARYADAMLAELAKEPQS